MTTCDLTAGHTGGHCGTWSRRGRAQQTNPATCAHHAQRRDGAALRIRVWATLISDPKERAAAKAILEPKTGGQPRLSRGTCRRGSGRSRGQKYRPMGRSRPYARATGRSVSEANPPAAQICPHIAALANHACSSASTAESRVSELFHYGNTCVSPLPQTSQLR